MPPRIPVPSRFGVRSLCFRPAPLLNTHLPIKTVANASTKAKKKVHRDQYAIAQAKQRKDANISRQKELREDRRIAIGDPVRGIATPFLESFDDVGGAAVIRATTTSDIPEEGETDKFLLNHYLTAAELEASLKHSQTFTEPYISTVRDTADPPMEAAALKKHQVDHARAVAAVRRIVSMSNSSQKDKTRANIRRCIETFGRHNTDQTLRPPLTPSPETLRNGEKLEKTPRAGLDTGSSEVQIAILTAKIRVLADQLEAPGGQKDKINKRNLRVMVHKRQKLLRYLRSKSRGGDRWQHLVSTLGLTDATWQGEISL